MHVVSCRRRFVFLIWPGAAVVCHPDTPYVANPSITIAIEAILTANRRRSGLVNAIRLDTKLAMLGQDPAMRRSFGGVGMLQIATM